MSIHSSRQDTGSAAQDSDTRPVVRGLAINPLWMVTFAAGLLFGMLAVLLTSG